MTHDPRIPVAVLGATGTVGQRFVSLLQDHPWFRIAELTASERSAGKPYGEAAAWHLPDPPPAEIAAMEVLPTDPAKAPLESRLVFSALDSKTAKAVEAPTARAGHFVVSNASAHRMDSDVPLIVPEVNPDHLGLLDHQPFGDGALVCNPNCAAIGLVLTLRPLADAFGIEAVQVTTMQAVSGAGLPGVPSLYAIDNLVPNIGGGGEEDKIEAETRRLLGRREGHEVKPGMFVVSAQVVRVPVIDGHTLCVSVRLDTMADLAEVRAAIEGFTAEPQHLGLPSAPERPVHVLDAEDRPQPRLDRDRDRGMAASLGRLRKCPLLDFKYVTLSHNTLRGAAGGSILLAELCLAQGRIAGLEPPA